jgi:hypothetical protein
MSQVPVQCNVQVICARIAATSNVILVEVWVVESSCLAVSATSPGEDMIAGHARWSVIAEHMRDGNST